MGAGCPPPPPYSQFWLFHELPSLLPTCEWGIDKANNSQRLGNSTLETGKNGSHRIISLNLYRGFLYLLQKFHKIDVSFVGNHIGSGANFCAAGVSEETTPSYVEDEEDEEDFLVRSWFFTPFSFCPGWGVNDPSDPPIFSSLFFLLQDRRLHNPKLSGSSYCTLPLLPEPNMKSNGGLGRLMEGQQSQFYNKIPPKEV